MAKRSSIGLGAAAVAAAALALGWLWRDYSTRQQYHRDMLIERGRTVLASLEGGLRSHRRMSMWFGDNLKSTLEGVAEAPGVKGLAVIAETGERVAQGGETPPDAPPDADGVFTDQGFWICRQTVFRDLEPRMEMPGAPMMHDAASGQGGMGMGMGMGMGRGGMRPLSEGEEDWAEKLIGKPVWLGALLDDASYLAEARQDRVRLAVSAALAVAAIAMIAAIARMSARHSRLAAELQLARERESRLRELTQLGAGLAHETKNPLSVIRGLAQSWLGQPQTPDEDRRRARQIVDEADRVTGRVNSFLSYSRPREPNLQPVDLGGALREAADLFADEAKAKCVRVMAAAESASALADPDMLRQTLVNLTTNALAACEPGGIIRLDLGRDEHGRLGFAVIDNGRGIAEEDLPRLTEPFFTRNPNGTGMGLAIVDQIVRAHGWTMEIKSAPRQGATVRVSKIQEAAEA